MVLGAQDFEMGWVLRFLLLNPLWPEWYLTASERACRLVAEVLFLCCSRKGKKWTFYSQVVPLLRRVDCMINLCSAV